MRLFSILLFFLAFTGHAQDLSLYEKREFIAPELNLPYRYLRPSAGDTARRPLVIFLHGADQRGRDNERPLNIGARLFLRDSVRERYPAYVLFPQCPEVDVWAYFEVKGDPLQPQLQFPFRKQPTETMAVLVRLVDSLCRTDRIDSRRIYLIGFSQGGMGVLDLLARFPQRFAAGISICGAGPASTAKRFAGGAALWLFHGDKDEVIPVSFSRDYFKRLRKAGADVRYTEYPGLGHNSSTKALGEPELLSWLFSKNQ